MLNRAAWFGAAAVCLVTSGCAENLSNKDVRRLGHYEIVYLPPESNITADSSGGAAYAALYVLAGPLAVAGGAMGVAQKNKYQQDALANKADEIKALGFDERIHATFVSAVEDASWLPNRDIKTVSGMGDPDGYTRQSKSDTVIYLKPRFTLTSFGRIFVVDVTAGVQQLINDHGDIRVAHLYTREFTFKHDLVLKKPGMTWDQQVAAGHQLAQMGSDDATLLWLENQGAPLRADFEQDFPQIEAGMREFFGDTSESPGS